MITATLYILIFGYSIGSRIGEYEGVSYMQFILPGLVMMGIIMSSYLNVVSSLYIAKFQGSIQELLVSPLSYRDIVTGFLAGGIARGVVVGIGITLVALFLSFIAILVR